MSSCWLSLSFMAGVCLHSNSAVRRSMSSALALVNCCQVAAIRGLQKERDSVPRLFSEFFAKTEKNAIRTESQGRPCKA